MLYLLQDFLFLTIKFVYNNRSVVCNEYHFEKRLIPFGDLIFQKNFTSQKALGFPSQSQEHIHITAQQDTKLASVIY